MRTGSPLGSCLRCQGAERLVMDRRAFLSTVGVGLLAAPLAPEAQPAGQGLPDSFSWDAVRFGYLAPARRVPARAAQARVGRPLSGIRRAPAEGRASRPPRMRGRGSASPSTDRGADLGRDRRRVRCHRQPAHRCRLRDLDPPAYNRRRDLADWAVRLPSGTQRPGWLRSRGRLS